jgi:hypothetical protein
MYQICQIDERKYLWGRTAQHILVKFCMHGNAPKGHPLIPIVTCPSVSFVPLQRTGLPGSELKKEPLVMMSKNSDIAQTSHIGSHPLQVPPPNINKDYTQ